MVLGPSEAVFVVRGWSDLHPGAEVRKHWRVSTSGVFRITGKCHGAEGRERLRLEDGDFFSLLVLF